MRDGTEGLLVTVADIIALPAFKNVELAAPCEGAERREVRNVGILDCPPDYNEYSVYVRANSSSRTSGSRSATLAWPRSRC